MLVWGVLPIHHALTVIGILTGCKWPVSTFMPGSCHVNKVILIFTAIHYNYNRTVSWSHWLVKLFC